jgi:transcriptional regulator with XRE-family HTH domain
MTFQQIQKYEHGPSRMAVSTLLKFAKVLDVPPEALLPPASRKSDELKSLATVLGERGVASLLKQVALIPEERRAEMVRALMKIIGRENELQFGRTRLSLFLVANPAEH